MRIKKLSATFGGLDHAALEPGPGLTVISAPNEGGKSTWTGFLRAMLYGIDTRERDRTGFLADKNRYQPWSGAPMAGELLAEWRGRDVAVRRFPSKTNPFGGFEAVYAATGDPVPGLTAGNVGEKLTGAGREVFLRSAFVGQGGAAISPSGELEARVAALATSGEEDVAWSAVERTLRDWRNRRRANRARGLIPQLEEERAALEQALRGRELALRCRGEMEEEREELEAERDRLREELELWARLERHELDRRCAEAYREWEQARAAVPEERPHPLFGTMTGEEAWAFAQEKQRERDAALEENRRRDSLREAVQKQYDSGRNAMVGSGVMAVWLLLMLAGYWLGFLRDNWLCALVACAGVAGFIFFFLKGRKAMRRAREKRSECQPVPVPETGDLLGQAAEYREALARAEQAKAAERAARRRAEDLTAQGGRLLDAPERIVPPARPKAETAARLAAAERELERVRGELARTEGALAHMGDGAAQEDRLAELEERLAARQEEYEALDIALEALGAANEQLRQRFSPALNRTAGELFSALTGGRYGGLSLARDFTALAEERDGLLPRPALALSAGTAEQLYLAVRLALCRLTLPDAPLVLDDALCAFDDERMALALACLNTMAEERQVLLFSCQRREADWARAHGCTVIEG